MVNKNNESVMIALRSVLSDRGIAVINSRELFMNQQEINIEHLDQIYRLRITRQGKLILTK